MAESELTVDERRESLKTALSELESIEFARDDMITPRGVVVKTDAYGLKADALRILAEHNARVGTNKNPDDPFEVFLD